MGQWKDGHHCLAKVKRVSWAGGSSKLVGELGTVGCVSGSRNLKPLCGSNESLSHNFGRENPTCAVDMCFSVPKMGDSVDSEGGDTSNQWNAGPRTQCRTYQANVLLSARRYYVWSPACL